MERFVCAIAAAVSLLLGVAWAQSQQQIATGSLPASAQQVIERLAQLNRIPDEE